MGNWKVISGVVVEPITLATAKLHLRVDNDDEDDLIAAMISAAREAAENYCCRVFSIQLISEVFPLFTSPLPLSVFPSSGVDLIEYTDVNGVNQIVPTGDYSFDSYAVPNCIQINQGKAWPALGVVVNPVRVRYLAGIASAEVPAPVKQAILLALADMYENRTDYVKRLPTASQRLLEPYRIFQF